MSSGVAQVVRVLVPVLALWFFIGLLILVLYHLSLFFVFGVFRNPDDLLLDLIMTALRVPVYFFAWPGVLYYDRSVVDKIRLFWRWLEPKNRTTDNELRELLAQRRQEEEVRRLEVADAGRRRRRQKELRSGAERARLTRRMRADSPELAAVRVLTGIGSGGAGERYLVRLFPDAVLAEEVKRKTEYELRVRKEWRCVRCRAEIEPKRLVLPEPFFLEVVAGEGVIFSGWAYEGCFRIEFEVCPKCGVTGPMVDEPLTIFPRADEVVAAVRAGIGFAVERTEPLLNRIMVIRSGGVVRVVAIFLGMVMVGLMFGVCSWIAVFLVSFFKSFSFF
ncbi:MAG: hypothetical protein ACP5JB_07400 [candidate division WOR-3 bacterium]